MFKEVINIDPDYISAQKMLAKVICDRAIEKLLWGGLPDSDRLQIVSSIKSLSANEPSPTIEPKQIIANLEKLLR